MPEPRLQPQAATPHDLANTPKFRKPPLIETVLGVQFKPFLNMRVTHYGLFWEQVKAQYPHVEEKEPLALMTEKQGISLRSLAWKMVERPEVRAWFLSEESDASKLGQRIIQLQTDALLLNWRRKSLHEQHYPSYSQNREEFTRLFHLWASFAAQHGLGNVAVIQCEITYVNHIPKEAAEQTVGQLLRDCFPGISGGNSDGFLPIPERGAFNFSYGLPDLQGRLHVDVTSAYQQQTKEPILDFKLTARGEPRSGELDDLLTWFDWGHFFAVHGFKSLTSERMHQRWELIR